ncbi:hypothetical protein [Aquisalinus flavus]|uniref:Uncharacterized protein n=1 Tax=Aquisalinus flavus TaxID=1526572 RepID=A0A8J2V1R1_9PROT|nr:hypothetical protein [Aquisalinus flavus]MBD0427736.1 hypothetical protein [Aquisalinus flavus]UNE47512.1 hypothetical protein FF099_05300 [Aquisalinus flavus]GGD03405.1 hypothetical protein GCM10011342_10510 [Aquisalinus flavus]
MSYGERKGVRKLPGEYNFADMIGFGLAGALGIVFAIMADMQQSDGGSALFTVSRWFSYVSVMIGIGSLPLYVVILILMAIGAGAVYYFQPVTLQGAFAQGFGVLAAVMTVAPSDIGRPLDAPDMPTIINESEASAGVQARFAGYVGDLEGSAMRDSLFQEAVLSSGSTPAVRSRPLAVALQSSEATSFNLTMEIMLPNGLKEEPDVMIRRGTMRGKLRNDDNGQTYNVFLNSGAIVRKSPTNDRLTIMTSVPGSGNTANLRARIEIDGYAINLESFTATAGRSNSWQISMTPSSTPMFMQRLNQSYDF